MRFAFFMPYFRDGGVETTTVRLADQLSKRGHETDLVTFQHDSPYLDESSLQVVDLDARRTLTSSIGLIRYLRRERPDVLVSAHHFANIVAVACRAISGTSPHLILTERLQVRHLLAEAESPKERLLPTLMRITYPYADDVVTVSRDAADALAELIAVPEDDVTAIYNATLVDEVFEKADEPLDHPWYGEDEPPVIVGAGRLTYQKDFHTLIRAFARARERLNARLVIFGEGEDRDSLERLAAKLGVEDAVDVHGFVDNPYKYMANADLFVLSSRYEGMPNVLVEAAALRTPVVATDCPSGPRELLGDGDAGELVPVEAPDEMAEAIVTQLSNPDEARERIERVQPTLEEFRPETTCERYLETARGQ